MNEIIQLLDILAWPVVVLTLALLFRIQLIALIERISSIKHGKTEIALNEKLKSIADKGSNNDTPKETPSTETDEKKLIYDLLDLDPLSAILVTWVEFNRIGRELLGIEPRSSNAVHLIGGLRDREYISDHDADILNMIRGIRNDAAHLRSDDIDLQTATKVCVILLQIISDLEGKHNQAG